MKKLSVLIMMGLLLVSCNKNDNNEINNEPISIPDYTPMQVGYFWVYEHVRVDSLGNETPLPYIQDSAYISKDTIIRGNKYFKFHRRTFGVFPNREYLRDSNGFLVNEKGMVLFSSDNFEDVLYVDTSYQVFEIHYHPPAHLALSKAQAVMNISESIWYTLVPMFFIMYILKTGEPLNLCIKGLMSS